MHKKFKEKKQQQFDIERKTKDKHHRFCKKNYPDNSIGDVYVDAMDEKIDKETKR